MATTTKSTAIVSVLTHTICWSTPLCMASSISPSVLTPDTSSTLPTLFWETHVVVWLGTHRCVGQRGLAPPQQVVPTRDHDWRVIKTPVFPSQVLKLQTWVRKLLLLASDRCWPPESVVGSELPVPHTLPFSLERSVSLTSTQCTH